MISTVRAITQVSLPNMMMVKDTYMAGISKRAILLEHKLNSTYHVHIIKNAY